VAFNASKDARRLQLESEIRALGFKPGEGKKKPDRAVKYRGPQGAVWTGVGAMAGWLKKLKDAGEGFGFSLENPTLNIIC